MCTVFGIAKGWWSVAGLIIEVIGFVFLLRVTVNDLVMKFPELVIATKGFEIEAIRNRDDLERTYNLFRRVVQRGTFVRLYIGGAIILLSFALQVVGSWPC